MQFSHKQSTVNVAEDCSADKNGLFLDTENVSERKKELRTLFRERRKSLSADDKRCFSEKLCKNILSLSEFKQADAVLSFYPLENETDIRAVNEETLRNGKILAFPRCVKGTGEMNFFSVKSFDELEKGSFSIYEPREGCPIFVPSVGKKIICLVPAMAYDGYGFRIGYGGGFYDRYLSRLGKNSSEKERSIFSVGVVYHPFLTDTLPHDEFDIAVDKVVTDLSVLDGE